MKFLVKNVVVQEEENRLDKQTGPFREIRNDSYVKTNFKKP